MIIIENLIQLANDLDAKIPAKKIDRNLLIGTWNIRAFGNLTRKWQSDDDDSPKRDLNSILCIAEIIKRFDVIAIQKVKANICALSGKLKCKTVTLVGIKRVHRHMPYLVV